MANPVVTYLLKLDDQASAPLDEVAESAKKTTKETGQASVSMKGLATASAAVGAAMLAGVTAVVAFHQAVADARNELTDMSVRTGVATTTLAGLRLAAEGSGVQLTQLESALSQLPRKMAETAEGTGPAADAFNSLGVAVVDTNGQLRDADTVLKETLAALNRVESPTRRAALATDLFGRSGGRLLQSLAGQELDDFIAASEQFGQNTGPDAADAAAHWQREVALLKEVMRGFADEFAEGFGANGGASEALELFTFSLITTRAFVGVVMEDIVDNVGRFKDAWTDVIAVLSGDPLAKLPDPDDLAIIPPDFAETWERAVQEAEAAGEAFQKTADTVTGLGAATGGAAGFVEDLGDEIEGAKVEVLSFEDALSQMLDELDDGAVYEATKDRAADLRSELARLSDEMGYALSPLENLTILEMDLGKALRENTINAEEYAESLELIGDAQERIAKEEKMERIEGVASGATQAAAGVASGSPTAAVGGATAAAGAVSPIVGIILAAVNIIAKVGEKGADSILERQRTFHDNLVKGIKELPRLVIGFIEQSIDPIPDLIGALVESAPEMFGPLIVSATKMFVDLTFKMPNMIAEAIGVGLLNWWTRSKPVWWNNPEISFLDALRSWWQELIGNAFGERGDAGFFQEGSLQRTLLGVATGGISETVGAFGRGIGAFQEGGYVPRDGLAFLHQGERVVAKGGPVTGSAQRNLSGNASGGGSKVELHIHSAVVDPDAIPALVRQIEGVFGPYGAATSPLFQGS